jgi:hypothetical protein
VPTPLLPQTPVKLRRLGGGGTSASASVSACAHEPIAARRGAREQGRLCARHPALLARIVARAERARRTYVAMCRR